MGKRNLTSNPTLIEPEKSELGKRPRLTRTMSPQNSAALTLLALMHAESTERNGDSSSSSSDSNRGRRLRYDQDDDDESRTYRSGEQKTRSQSICSSITDDEDDSVKEGGDSAFGVTIRNRKVTGNTSAVFEPNPVGATVSVPRLSPHVQRFDIALGPLPPGRPLPPAPGLPKGLMPAFGKSPPSSPKQQLGRDLRKSLVPSTSAKNSTDCGVKKVPK